MSLQAKKIINGTWGRVTIDGEEVASCYGCSLKLSYNKESVAQGGSMMEDSKTLSITGTGSLMLHKVDSLLLQKTGEAIRKGKDVRATIISEIADPDAYGAERIAVKGVSFDDLTLADWQHKQLTQLQVPFTFSDYQLLDLIDPQ